MLIAARLGQPADTVAADLEPWPTCSPASGLPDQNGVVPHPPPAADLALRP